MTRSSSIVGLFTHDGAFLTMEDVDFGPLEEIFRERFLKLLVRRGRVLPETVDVIRSWEHSGFNIGWDRRLQARGPPALDALDPASTPQSGRQNVPEFSAPKFYDRLPADEDYCVDTPAPDDSA